MVVFSEYRNKARLFQGFLLQEKGEAGHLTAPLASGTVVDGNNSLPRARKAAGA